MGGNEIKLNCCIDKDDYMIVDYFMGQVGIDLFNTSNGETTSMGLVLTNEQAGDLIEFLKKFVQR